MTYRPRRACRRCLTDRDVAGRLSHSGLCLPCSEEAAAEAALMMAGHYGPLWAKWLESMSAAVARLYLAGVSDYPPPGLVCPGSAHDRIAATLDTDRARVQS